jgi:hypothetical protein
LLTDFAERRLITLRHAALYITELLKTEHDAEWRAATEALVLYQRWRANGDGADRNDAGCCTANR